VEERPSLAIALYVHGSVMQARGNRRQAVEELTEALFLETSDKLCLAWCLEGLAGIATDIAQPERAARFLGAASGLREAIHAPVQPWERPAIQTTTAGARAALGVEAMTAAWSAGRAIGLDEIAAEVRGVAAALAGYETGSCVVPANHGLLTPRELEVLRLLSAGHTDQEIAAELFISPHTVTSHVKHLLAKLEVGSRAAAVAHAYRDGLIRPATP
jgi:non-specific serine/threonine protein kinase